MAGNSNETELRHKARALRALIKRRLARIQELHGDRRYAENQLREIERQLAEYEPMRTRQ